MTPKITGEIEPKLKARVNNIQLHIDQLMTKYEPEDMKEILLALINKKQALVEMI